MLDKQRRARGHFSKTRLLRAERIGEGTLEAVFVGEDGKSGVLELLVRVNNPRGIYGIDSVANANLLVLVWNFERELKLKCFETAGH